VTRVIISRPARRDLTAIGDYIARNNPRAAEKFIRELRAQCSLLKAVPWMGRVRGEFGRNIHSIRYRTYLVFYLYRDHLDRVDVLRFWHTSRLPPDLSDLLK
jgi:toxin ParE1/3/4